MLKPVKTTLTVRRVAATVGTAALMFSAAACAPQKEADTHFENGASDVKTGWHKVENTEGQTVDVTVARYVDSIVPKNAERVPGDQSRFVALKLKFVNWSGKPVNPQWIMDKTVLVDENNKLFSPTKIGGDASDGPLIRTWTTLDKAGENSAYLTYEVAFGTTVKSVKVDLPEYPEAEWKVNVSSTQVG